jgi:cytochrome c
LKVTDSRNISHTDTVVVKVGNTKPQVSIVTENNRSFFWKNKPFTYSVKVNDPEDGKINPEKVAVTFDYNPEPGLTAPQAMATPKLIQTSEPPSPGYLRIMASDCKACHTAKDKSVGPSYSEIAKRYKGKPNVLAILSQKIIDGGGGNWGTEHVMSAHPQLSFEEVTDMVRYILEINDPKNIRRTLPLHGSVALTAHRENERRGVYTITAKYSDNGGNGIGPLSDSEVVRLRNAKMRPIDADQYEGIGRWRDSFSSAKNKAYVLLSNVDMTGIRKITYEYGSKDRSGEIELRLESLAGPVIARTPFKPTGGWDKKEVVTHTLDAPVSGRHHVYLVIVNRDKTTDDIVKLWSFEFGQ